MPQAVGEVHSVRDDVVSLEDCPLHQFCHCKCIVSTVSDTVLAAVHAPLGVGIILHYVQFGGFVVPCAHDP